MGNPSTFFGLAAQIMGRTLIEHARARQREKRGGQQLRVSLSEATNAAQELLLRLFQKQVLSQCEFMIFAAED